MIPKKIHYCWFGEKEPGELEQKCIESWKKILPDYELRFWGNDCLDRFDNKYLRQAVEAKKWAFVSDYVRLYALLEEGGLYFDTDEEVVRRLDEFMEHHKEEVEDQDKQIMDMLEFLTEWLVNHILHVDGQIPKME